MGHKLFSSFLQMFINNTITKSIEQIYKSLYLIITDISICSSQDFSCFLNCHSLLGQSVSPCLGACRKVLVKFPRLKGVILFYLFLITFQIFFNIKCYSFIFSSVPIKSYIPVCDFFFYFLIFIIIFNFSPYIYWKLIRTYSW